MNVVSIHLTWLRRAVFVMLLAVSLDVGPGRRAEAADAPTSLTSSRIELTPRRGNGFNIVCTIRNRSARPMKMAVLDNWHPVLAAGDGDVGNAEDKSPHSSASA